MSRLNLKKSGMNRTGKKSNASASFCLPKKKDRMLSSATATNTAGTAVEMSVQKQSQEVVPSQRAVIAGISQDTVPRGAQARIRLGVDLTPDRHRRLRTYAAANCTTMLKVVEGWIDEHCIG